MNNESIIDINGLQAIVNRLKLYIENEEKTIISIKKALNNLNSLYISNNSNKALEKTNNLYNNLDIMLNNRQRYVEYINNIISIYITTDDQNYFIYKDKDIN